MMGVGLKNFAEEMRFKKIKNEFDKNLQETIPLLTKIENKGKVEEA